MTTTCRKPESRCCPWCGRDELRPGRSHDAIAQHMTCLRCGQKWKDIYVLDRVEAVHERSE